MPCDHRRVDYRMPSPSAATDVATKTYVDSTAQPDILAQSRLATAAVLPNTPTYANGASGVGATLTRPPTPR